jgi:hypothetical protein
LAQSNVTRRPGKQLCAKKGDFAPNNLTLRQMSLLCAKMNFFGAR